MRAQTQVAIHQRVQILTCDPSQRIVQAMMKDGGNVQLSVWETPPAFRWPQPDEVWEAKRVGNQWLLGHRIVDGTTEDFPVESMQPGELRLDASTILDANGVPIRTGPVTRITADYSLTAGDSIILADATSAPITVTCPSAANTASFTVKRLNAGTHTVTISGLDTDTIDGKSSCPLTAQYQAITVVTDGTAWYIV